jgi:hypothetical protein
MSPEFDSLTIEITLPANRDFLGSLKVWSDVGEIVAGPFPVAGRASDDIAAEHGNPTRAPTLPYGDPPAGTFRYSGKIATGGGSRLRQDLFGPKPVIVLLPTGGPAALGDANGRFEIFIHGGPPAPSGGLRATSGHFRIRDPDLEVLGDIVERAGRVRCVCVETAIPGRAVVAGLGTPRQATANPDRPRRTPKRLVPYEALVAFGEYTSPDPAPLNPATERSLNSPTLGPAGQQGLAQLGMVNICQSMRDSANLAACTDTNAYTGGPANTNAAADNAFTSWQTSYYPSGQSPFYPNGQNVNAYNSPPGATGGAVSAPQPVSTNLPSALAPGVASGSVAASLPLTNLPSASLTSLGTASPFGNGPNPFMPSPVPRVESANAWASARPSAAAQSAIQEQIQMGFLDPSLGVPGANISTATAQTNRSITTSIRAQTAEITGYDAHLASGEIGIIAPSGSNVPGLDYFTVTPLPEGGYAFNVVDMKSRVSQNAFGQVPGSTPDSWLNAADRGIEQLDLGNPQLEQEIRDAWAASRATVTPVRDTMDFGPEAGRVTALSGEGYGGGLTVGGTPVALDQPPAGLAPTDQPPAGLASTMPLGGRLLGGGLGLAGAGISGFALGNDIANGQWLAAGADSTSFVSSSLIAGGAAAGSSSLLQAGQTFGVVTAPVTAVYSGYTFGNDVANGQWLAATADASSLTSSLLMFGGWLAGSAALGSAGMVVGAFGAGLGIGTLINNYLLSENTQEAIGYVVNSVVNEGGWRDLYKHPFGVTWSTSDFLGMWRGALGD